MRYISRSSYDAFMECPRKGYWRYLSGPWGADSTLGLEEVAARNDYYGIGIGWHAGAEKLVSGGSATEAYAAALSTDPERSLGVIWHNWLLAAFLAWERAKRDEFFERFEVLSIEDEFEIPISPNVVLYTRADAVVRDRSDGSAWVLNWKTAADLKDWNRKWFFDPQGWTEAIAAEAKLGILISGSLYLGVWKGPFYQGNTTSRLIYGYKHYGKSEVTYGTESGTRAGTARFEAWREEFPFGSGLAAWISWLPMDFLRKHFCESAPQLRQDKLVEDWLKQIIKQEDNYDYVLESGEGINETFPQKFSDFTCGRCPFKDICLGRAEPTALIEEGFLKPRSRSPRDEAAGRAAEGAEA